MSAPGERDPSDEVCDSHIRQVPPGSSHMFHAPIHRANESTLRTLARSVFDLHISSQSNSEAIFDPNVMSSLTILLSSLLWQILFIFDNFFLYLFGMQQTNMESSVKGESTGVRSK